MTNPMQFSYLAAINLIAAVVYTPNRSGRDAARKAIDRAVDRSKLDVDVSRNIKRGSLYLWAGKKWPRHRDFFGIPPAIVERAKTSVIGQEIGLRLSSDAPANQPHSYVRELKSRLTCEKRLRDLQERYDALLAETELLRRKKRAISEKLSAAGRKGGRGRAM